jgi:glycosyltransferase involved in cell wall biosynthesis
VTRAIAYFGTYDLTYPRNAVLMSGLRELGAVVYEFHAPLPELSAAEMTASRGAARVALAVAIAHARLLAQHPRSLAVDAVLVGYPGHFLVPFGGLMAAFRHARLVFDPLVSLWDTFARDRGLVDGVGWKGSALRGVDRVAFALPSLVLADTRAHAAYYSAVFGLPTSRLAVVPVGALPAPQATGGARALGPDEKLTVFQYGKWSPLHGADTVLSAAELLRAEPIRFVFAGEGQLSGALRGRIAERRLDNVEWLGMLTPQALRAQTLAADVCLGVFGRSEKSGRVIPNKVYDALACGRPVVTADTPGAREQLRDGETALLVPVADGVALAETLRGLLAVEERRRLGVAALGLYRQACTPAKVAEALLAALDAK